MTTLVQKAEELRREILAAFSSACACGGRMGCTSCHGTGTVVPDVRHPDVLAATGLLVADFAAAFGHPDPELRGLLRWWETYRIRAMIHALSGINKQEVQAEILRREALTGEKADIMRSALQAYCVLGSEPTEQQVRRFLDELGGDGSELV